MTEAERNSFFAHSSQRAPGKRQIKPTAAMEQMVLPADEDEDDEDFKADLGSGSEGSESESSEESSEGEEEEGEGGENDEDTDYLKSLKNKPDDEEEEEEPICSICLNLRPGSAKDEVIQCDKCGVAVHEQCYGVDQELGGDADSTESASVTEPWFCEPCIHDEKEPPHCELCPGRYGAMKRSDIGGRWAHLLCALYTPGITFGNVESLLAVSWQEIDYKQFGKKACSGCSDRLESRTGIVIGCDAALCRNYYHPSCAQRLGLLIDRTEDFDPEDDELHDERFIHCKKHSHEEDVRKKREAYAIFARQEEKRFATMLKRKRLNEREEDKRQKMQERSLARYKKMDGVTISVPDASWDKGDSKNRRARHLHTSSRFLDGFSNKAELVGVGRDEFEKAFIKVDGRSLLFLPPAFSPEFVAYFNHREKHVMTSEKNRLERVNAERDKMREEQQNKEKKYHELEEEHKTSQASLQAAVERMTKIHSILTRLGAKKIPKIGEIIRNQPATPRSRLFSRSSISDGPSTSRHSHVMKSCATCSSIKDQHLLVECDSCHKHYHLQCVDPPLERMPKKKMCDWHCSECAEDSSDEETKKKTKKGDKTEGEKETEEDEDQIGARKLRRRSDSVKQRKLAEKEAELREYKSAIGRGTNPPKRISKPTKRYSTETPPPLLTPSVVIPPSRITPPEDEPPFKRGRGRPRKTPSVTSSPEKNGRMSMDTSSVSSRLSRPSLSPHAHNQGGRRTNGRMVVESAENEEEDEDDEEQMEQIVIIKE
ncbi:hypothetical protein PFISCL1PPCAC_2422 [Pristionchus fissidentatus]|uniref:PHD finger protein 14 n=1 Tax=Pristionchus fissidentatus TaxID=1538716 RepID=A0AAV5UY28_9BILA|nr:hypothetical protein PFISCL1PPCAC_2422 [Pristionchus fissidentatus]